MGEAEDHGAGQGPSKGEAGTQAALAQSTEAQSTKWVLPRLGRSRKLMGRIPLWPNRCKTEASSQELGTEGCAGGMGLTGLTLGPEAWNQSSTDPCRRLRLIPEPACLESQALGEGPIAADGPHVAGAESPRRGSAVVD